MYKKTVNWYCKILTKDKNKRLTLVLIKKEYISQFLDECNVNKTDTDTIIGQGGREEGKSKCAKKLWYCKIWTKDKKQTLTLVLIKNGNLMLIKQTLVKEEKRTVKDQCTKNPWNNTVRFWLNTKT